MKRRVIQIADSTQLISLPRKWCKKFEIKKGDEMEVTEEGSRIIVSSGKQPEVERVEIEIDNLEPMNYRIIHALYKKGVDEIKINFNKPELAEVVQSAVRNEASGFEITEEGKNYCIIKNVTGGLEKFEPVLRRTFLLLVSMADKSLEAIKKHELNQLKNVMSLEEANNRFTTICRRFINKEGYNDIRNVGPLYYIIEDLENIADEYKFLCKYLYKRKDKKITVNKNILQLYEKVNNMLRDFYELFYKFDKDKVAKIGSDRKEVVDEVLRLFEKNPNPTEIVVLHHLLTITQKIFCLVGPYLVIKL